MPKRAKQPAKPSLAQLQAKVRELTDALMRERADATNIRRQSEEQLTGLRSLVKADVVRALLPVVDSFERSLKHVPKHLAGDDYVKGVEGIIRQFEKTLEELGVEKITTVGAPFDPHLHEAVSMEDGQGKREVVSEELQAGYKLGDQVIRHAIVKVKMTN
jgi:molecular chaperone GrpE